MATPEHIIQDVIDKDLASGKLRRIDEYKVAVEIDIDCEELLDAIGLDYKQCEDDDTQNEVMLSLTPAEATDVLDQTVLSMTNEQTIATLLLNDELGEYTTKVTIYTPSGDKICFS